LIGLFGQHTAQLATKIGVITYDYDKCKKTNPIQEVIKPLPVIDPNIPEPIKPNVTVPV
jgi:hypothetical protein